MDLTNNSTLNFTSAVFENLVPQSSVLITNVRNGIHALSFLVGFPTHSYIIWLIVTGRQNRIASEFFHLNLSVCEIFNCLCCLFTVLLTFPLLSGLFSFAVFVYFFTGFATAARPLFQCLMCVERYLAVVHPVTFLKYKPLRYRVICCFVAWILTLASCFFCMFTSMLGHIYAYAFINSVQFLLFLSIQLFCLVAVLRALKQSGPGERKREKEENHMKRRAFCIILITTLSMSVTYIPLALSIFFYFLTHNFNDPVSISVIFFILAGFIQPVLYLHSAGKRSCVCSSQNQ